MRGTGTLSSKAACRIIGGALDISLKPFPAVVRIETTNACNARCTICPHQRMTRAVGHMNDELFARIIDECADHKCPEVHLHNFGEPLLDRSLEQRVAYAKQKGIAKVKIFSNGSLLTEPRARRLIEAGLDEIKVSFDGATREEFEEIRTPLEFERVVRNVKGVVGVRNAMDSPMRIRVACCSTQDKQGTMRSLEAAVDGFSFGKIHNWAGDGGATAAGGIRKPCSRLWRTFTILASGEVALCCLDYDGQHIMGRIGPGGSILKVWRGDAYRRVRRQHKAGRQAEIPLCRDCSKAFVQLPLSRKAA